jgi:crotonobetainyl-CoA:carnitine CoA-transferase CaiB-like acyl-CoA transferase
VAISTSADSVAARVMELVGLGGDSRVATVADRMEHRTLVEERVTAWVAERSLAEALEAMERADAAAAQVYGMDDLVEDPHIVARGTFVEVDGYPMPGVIAQLSATPGEVRWPGRSVGSDQASVFDEFGLAAPDTEE